jgi:hypothetical protein
VKEPKRENRGGIEMDEPWMNQENCMVLGVERSGYCICQVGVSLVIWSRDMAEEDHLDIPFIQDLSLRLYGTRNSMFISS